MGTIVVLSWAFVVCGSALAGAETKPPVMLFDFESPEQIAKVGVSDGARVGHGLVVLGESRSLPALNGSFADEFEPKVTHVYTTCPNPPVVPDVLAIRHETETLERELKEHQKRNVACINNGAMITTSWTPRCTKRAAVFRWWHHVNDGFPGSYFSVSDGLGGRIEILFKEPARIDRLVVITSGVTYDLEILRGGNWTKTPAAAEVVRSNAYDPKIETATACYRFELVLAKGIRLNNLRKAPGVPRVYEIEAYREGNGSDAH